MTPYPDGYGAPPQCATCVYFFATAGRNSPPVCALRQQVTSPTNACVNWALWIATAQPTNLPN